MDKTSVHPPAMPDGEESSKSPETDEYGRPMTLFGDILRATGQMKIPVKPTAKVNEKYRPLFKAVLKGDWKAVEQILNADREAIKAEVLTVQSNRLRVFDVAIMAAQDQMCENLVNHLPPETEVLIFKRALMNAARRGRISMVKALVDKVDDDLGEYLQTAISFAPMHTEVIWYLAERITSPPTYDILKGLIWAGYMDIALYLARAYPNKAIIMDNLYESNLGHLASMKSYFRSGARLNFWENSIYKCIPLCLFSTTFGNAKDTKIAQVNWLKVLLKNLATKPAPFIKRIGELKWRHECSLQFADLVLDKKENRMGTARVLEFLLTSGIVLDAASHGIFEIVNICLKHFPELMWEKNFTKGLIQEAVSKRLVELFRLVNAHKKTAALTEDVIVNDNLMKAFVQSSPGCVSADISGAALQMQREIQWYKVLEDGIDPSLKCLRAINNEKTYWESFVETRQNSLKEAGQWMKDTSSSCSLVATLIITIAFAAAFTVPGGIDGSTGVPIFLKKGSFMVFMVADALAFFSSVTATLMFLAILTSRYVIEDFLHSLPRKMILGLTLLFLSLAFMLVAFSSALTIILSERLKLSYIPITLLATFPVVLFAILQLPLYVEMVESTYRPCLYRPLELCK